jgi:hypothetical protein
VYRSHIALWARYGLDVKAIHNMGVPVVWENVQNPDNYKHYVRRKVPWGGYAYPAYHLNPAFNQWDVYASMAKLKNHWIAGVTITMKNNFGNTPGSLYGGGCGPSGNERPTQERGPVLHDGKTPAPKGVDAELHPDSPRDPGYRVPRILVDQNGHSPHRPGDCGWRRDGAGRRRSVARRPGEDDPGGHHCRPQRRQRGRGGHGRDEL